MSIVKYPSVATLSVLRNGRLDPTTLIGPDYFCRATHTPDGLGIIHVRRLDDGVDIEVHGPGGTWLEDHSASLLGCHDHPPLIDAPHEVIRNAQRRHGHVQLVRSGTAYHELIPAVLGQRVTAAEAVRQWRQLSMTFGTKFLLHDIELWSPPDPLALAHLPYHTFHRFGIERRRAEALRVVARHFEHLSSLYNFSGTPSEATNQLTLLPGVGPWTAAVAGFVAFGDADAVAVGDFHLKNMVSYALTGRHRGTDTEMLELLEPYRPHRGRVIRWLSLDGWSAPKHGPRRRNLTIARF
ncbi:MAG: DNA-3-methyladenine glycosylase 2 family protein [Actinobacteria bacterium]|nr:DNA-3-methyladenine glycosylase 2 family protein [Actinomycetota bacterium]